MPNAQATLTGLQSGQRYSIRVRMLTTKGDSPWSDVIVASTKDMEITRTKKMKQNLGIHDNEMAISDLKKNLEQKQQSILALENTVHVLENACKFYYATMCKQ